MDPADRLTRVHNPKRKKQRPVFKVRFRLTALDLVSRGGRLGCRDWSTSRSDIA